MIKQTEQFQQQLEEVLLALHEIPKRHRSFAFSFIPLHRITGWDALEQYFKPLAKDEDELTDKVMDILTALVQLDLVDEGASVKGFGPNRSSPDGGNGQDGDDEDDDDDDEDGNTRVDYALNSTVATLLRKARKGDDARATIRKILEARFSGRPLPDKLIKVDSATSGDAAAEVTVKKEDATPRRNDDGKVNGVTKKGTAKKAVAASEKKGGNTASPAVKKPQAPSSPRGPKRASKDADASEQDQPDEDSLPQSKRPRRGAAKSDEVAKLEDDLKHANEENAKLKKQIDDLKKQMTGALASGSIEIPNADGGSGSAAKTTESNCIVM
ncbi:hypothetical protein HDU76_007699 [Blyttiomyces sp. JEL0837]|nr:hypothetical protein HDU76_007699 [Blyttiomyces sp. JEL0837]